MAIFVLNKAAAPKPLVHISQATHPLGTTHVMVRVQQGFETPAAAVFPPTDACISALERLVEQFKPQPNIESLICSLADRSQPILNAIEDTKAFRNLDTATGQQLDELGTLYLAPRNGKTDDAYRAFLKGQAFVVASKGGGDELLDALVTLDDGFDVGSIQLIEHHPAAFIMTAKVPAGQQLLGEEHASVLRRMVAGGVRFVFLFEAASTTLFVWSGETGEGWAEEASPGTTGAIWAEGV